ncbi:DgyrCDS7736 [Dimorphilus gyrociliatus]|uniref:DgyrCDS7736 n=1 Tax=Dimorphilus gyrociliatus TaxID=2664684 RepID=A0A7I8VRZ9_9ANNE|nr:DgyrCDS7736 [Dimorphilus gyrociliatus]
MSHQEIVENPLLSLLMRSEDINCDGLAETFEGSLSGLGIESNTHNYNMTEALQALPKCRESSICNTSFSPDCCLTSPSIESNEINLECELIAPTSAATKQTEETLTYLNQGQNYELKLFRGDNSLNDMKSIIRIIFHERKMQFTEKELLDRWRNEHPGKRFIDVDLPLCLGLTDLSIDPDVLNTATVFWYESCSISLKVHCISTEFTLRKHGGEKGVPFRIQVETYDKNEEKLLHCASCQIKVFKPKGADRKHKTDREKIEKKQIDERRKYRPVAATTILKHIPLEMVQSYHIMNNKNQIPDIDRNAEIVFNIPTPSPTEVVKFPSESSEIISIQSTAAEVVEWLNNNRFSEYSKVFENYAGKDILRLSRGDLIEICGNLADGIRLNNALQCKNIRPRLTLFIRQENTVDKRNCDKDDSRLLTRVRSEGSLLFTNDDSLITSLNNFQESLQQQDPKPYRKVVKGKRTNCIGIGLKEGPIINCANPRSKRHKDDSDISDDEAYYLKKQKKNRVLSEDNTYHALHLNDLDLSSLRDGLAEFFGENKNSFKEIYTIEEEGIFVCVCDEVIRSIKDRSKFSVEFSQDEEKGDLKVFMRYIT